MNIWCFLLTKFSNIFLNKSLSREFALKYAAKFFKTLLYWAFEALRENQKLDQEFEKFSQVFKKLVRVIKSLATCLCYNIAHGFPISSGKREKKS